MASALTVVLFVPAASADNLTERRDKVSRALARTKADLSESSHALSAAGAALASAQERLDAARAQLARTQDELSAAKARDVAMAAKLKKARAELARAKAAVAAGQRALDAKKRMAGNLVRDQYQQQTNLMPIALLLENTSTSDLQTRLQWSTTMFDTTGAAIEELRVLQAKLEAEKTRQADLEAQIAADRRQAAANLEVRKRLQAQAAAEEADVTSLVQERQAVEAAAADDVAADRAQYAKLTQERASVEKRIAARIARAKAEAAARRAAEQRARQAAARRAAAQAEAEARRAKNRAREARQRSAAPPSRPKQRPANPRPSKPRPPAGGGSGSGGQRTPAPEGFSLPLSAPITSPFGNRFHPVLRVWKLHDGTDFGAGCGTPLRAPYSGRVAERYYNSAYGNRLMIDHGYVKGRYVTTGYNHAIRYSVSVGQRVSKGQVIGYVGTTGYSTGCHLHLMVWLDGGLANPMTWF
ncbi:MAG: Membrane proteins related to metalloendopeptidases [uncultured Friedmanniella sp.]|uniref:Membrane proteins related to metalloendopeptidases n=1 Tax=uncultured Friedmanniella sp. TaxID=335381 RepID=A0A6J4L8T1_9ACTN|nr:M23 family metallopeptidase [uncultured Friedmanniella sp.]CAA9322339.1 MAG: Membrane proteins related to metalloendopeptidases [uncultured Friedmanniella sp.]